MNHGSNILLALLLTPRVKNFGKKSNVVLDLIQSSQHISFLKHDNQIFAPVKNIAETLGKTLASVSSSESYDEPFLSYKRQMERTRINFNAGLMFSYNQPFKDFEFKNN